MPTHSSRVCVNRQQCGWNRNYVRVGAAAKAEEGGGGKLAEEREEEEEGWEREKAHENEGESGDGDILYPFGHLENQPRVSLLSLTHAFNSWWQCLLKAALTCSAEDYSSSWSSKLFPNWLQIQWVNQLCVFMSLNVHCISDGCSLYDDRLSVCQSEYTVLIQDSLHNPSHVQQKQMMKTEFSSFAGFIIKNSLS